MSRARRARWGIAGIALVAVALSGCATTVAGTAVMAAGPGAAGQQDPGRPGDPGPGQKLPPDTGVPDSAVGLKPDVPPAGVTVSGDAHSQADTLAKDTIADLDAFYTAGLPPAFGKQFVAPAHYLSYDSRDKSARVCGQSLYQVENAAYAGPPCDTVVWDRGVLLPQLMHNIGPLAVPTTLAHEMGHRVQYLLGFDQAKNTVLVAEQQADCYAGAYWRWVADGHSGYFAFNQTAGMAQALTTMLHIRDTPGGDPKEQDGTGQGAHGDAFDRAFAFTLGYADGIKRCNAIDQKAVDARVSESPFSQIPNPKTAGNLPVTDGVISDVATTVNAYFSQTVPGYRAPTLSATGPAACQGFTVSRPADYCPPTNIVSYDLRELQRIGTPTAGFDSYNGDFSAIILVVSRYAVAAQAVAAQNQGGAGGSGTPGGTAAVTGDAAGLRSACFAGSWAVWMRHPQGPKRLALSPADLDKAVYELINSPLAGSDANGAGATSIFDRLQAFDIGVTNPLATCTSYYPG